MGILPSGTESRPRRGERRDLTVIFCDLVRSSELVESLEDELWDRILTDYFETCEAVVARFGGTVKERAGDGLVAYFGFQVGREDDAHRAVRTGLGVVDAMDGLNARWHPWGASRLHVRVGIDTGSAIVRDGTATGIVFHVAARLQSKANDDTVVVSGSTFDLVRERFTHEDLGVQPLKNIAHPVQVHRIISESDIPPIRPLTPLVGRDAEREELLNLWNLARSGRSQIAFIEGEAGIGKSRLVKVLRENIANCVEVRCSLYDSHSALFPLTRSLERLLGFDRLDNPSQKLTRLEQKLLALGFPLPDVIPLLASHFSLPLPGDDPLVNMPPETKRRQTLKVLVDWLVKEAEREPLMAVWEDLHWADPSTLELIGLVIERVSKTDTPLLSLMTFRPDEFQPPWPMTASTTLVLRRLERLDVEEMIRKITNEESLPREQVDEIFEQTDGLPFFVEELLPTVVRSRVGPPLLRHPSLPISIPVRLNAFLTARLDRLGAEAKMIAQRGAILGRAFSRDVLRAVLETEARDAERNEDEWTEAWVRAERCLTRLVDAGVLRQGEIDRSAYEFRHALIQKAAYKSLLNTDKQPYHLQTARVLETQFAQIAEAQPELVAWHYTEAVHLAGVMTGDEQQTVARAVAYWQKAGERARDRSANKEAMHHFAEALKIIEALPPSDTRDRCELSLRIASVTPIIAVEGYVAEATARTAERAEVLCRQIGNVDRLFPALYTLWANRIVAARYTEALTLSEEFFREASLQPDPAPRLMGHRLRAISLCMDGQLAVAEDHLKDSLRLYEPGRHEELKTQGYGQDPKATCEAFMALVRWLRGYPDDAATYSGRSIEHAQQAKHTNTLGYVLCFGAATFEAFRRDVARTAQHTSTLLTFAGKEGLPVWFAYARVLHGWTLAQTGRVDHGVAEMKAGLSHFEDASPTAASSALNMGFMRSFLLSLLGETYGNLGRLDEALAQLDTAWAFTEAMGEKFWRAELRRLRGELLLKAGGGPTGSNRQEAEACFRQALAIASNQGARALELRAAISLGHLIGPVNSFEARAILQHAYGTFTEGFDSADLIDARQLLAELADERGEREA